MLNKPDRHGLTMQQKEEDKLTAQEYFREKQLEYELQRFKFKGIIETTFEFKNPLW